MAYPEKFFNRGIQYVDSEGTISVDGLSDERVRSANEI